MRGRDGALRVDVAVSVFLGVVPDAWRLAAVGVLPARAALQDDGEEQAQHHEPQDEARDARRGFEEELIYTDDIHTLESIYV